VNLGTTQLALERLMSLKVGDVIPLDQDASGEFDVLVENQKKFRAYYGIYHGTVAVQVTRPITKRGRYG
jgi:flagellar motor switch protein FliM